VSTFSGLNTATTALWAQQRGLDVAGQNIANVNTAGYTRQRADLQSVGGNAVPAMYAVSTQVGQGVDADQVIRIRDAFLESRAQVEGAATASMTVRDDTLAQIEQAFREPGTTGIQAKMDAVFAAWGDVANHPTEDGARSSVLHTTQTLVADLHTTTANLDKQWTQVRSSLDALKQDVNAKAASIADLNTAIKRATQTGQPVNELADKRDVLVQDLAALIGATSTPGDDGQVGVIVSGATLVSGGSATSLGVVGTRDPGTAAPGNPAFTTDPGGTGVNVGGTAGGKLTALTVTIPGYQDQLNRVARKLADQFNTAHMAGFDKAGVAGEPMFDDGSGTLPVDTAPATSPISAANLRLRITTTDKLAAAVVGGQATADARNATAMAQLQNTPGGASVSYRQLIVGLGIEASVATSNLDTQKVISSRVDASRESVSGVNLDEEMTNMLQFQHAYSAAARMITAIDETLDVLINRTGRVGL
jgi:flagellar hook-associated protein 1 FlgK